MGGVINFIQVHGSGGCVTVVFTVRGFLDVTQLLLSL